MQQALEVRRTKGTIRRLQGSTDPSLQQAKTSIDFSSNDYLGLAHDRKQHLQVEKTFQDVKASDHSAVVLGATGSRLLSGDAPAFHLLEEYLAKIHNRKAALLCNSGYDANLIVVSCLPCDVIVYDEYVHNSLHMGMRLWQTARSNRLTLKFQHNDTRDLQNQLQRIQKTHPEQRVVVLIESVYSMDGDVAPVKEMLGMAATFDAQMIVDEAHGLGVYGRQGQSTGLVPPGTGVVAAENVEKHPSLLCCVYTFGKAAGCHGAVLCFSTSTHKDYIVNYGYPLIYSTALPLHSLVTIRCSYETMTGRKGDLLRTNVFQLVHFFREKLEGFLDPDGMVYLLPSTSPIQALIVPDNHLCTQFCSLLWEASGRRIRLYPIKSPTVPAGQERVRIVIHANNTSQQVELLVQLIVRCLMAMDLLLPNSRL